MSETHDVVTAELVEEEEQADGCYGDVEQLSSRLAPQFRLRLAPFRLMPFVGNQFLHDGRCHYLSLIDDLLSRLHPSREDGHQLVDFLLLVDTLGCVIPQVRVDVAVQFDTEQQRSHRGVHGHELLVHHLLRLQPLGRHYHTLVEGVDMHVARVQVLQDAVTAVRENAFLVSLAQLDRHLDGLPQGHSRQ